MRWTLGAQDMALCLATTARKSWPITAAGVRMFASCLSVLSGEFPRTAPGVLAFRTSGLPKEAWRMLGCRIALGVLGGCLALHMLQQIRLGFIPDSGRERRH